MHAGANVLQAVTPSAGRPAPIEFNLMLTGNGKACASDDSDDIVVCGRRDAGRRYRLQPLDAARFEPERRAETTLTGDLKGAVEVESKEIAPGITSNRIMFRLKLPF